MTCISKVFEALIFAELQKALRTKIFPNKRFHKKPVLKPPRFSASLSDIFDCLNFQTLLPLYLRLEEVFMKDWRKKMLEKLAWGIALWQQRSCFRLTKKLPFLKSQIVKLCLIRTGNQEWSTIRIVAWPFFFNISINDLYSHVMSKCFG